MLGCSVPRRRGTWPETQVVGALVDQPSDLGVEQGGVDPLPSPVASRCRRAARIATVAYMPHMTSAMPTPTFIGIAVGRAGEAHDPAQALGQVVVAGTRGVGAGLAEAGDEQ